MTAGKRSYVMGQGQTRKHGCHWPGCDKQVPPALWGCKPHWYKLPKDLRDRIWLEYRIGQEMDLSPSEGYVTAAMEAQQWIAAQGATP